MFTKERAAALLPLIQALADGKTIQVNMLVGPDKREWHDIYKPCFSGKPEDYRVKPEPEIEHRYFNVYHFRSKDVGIGCAYPTAISAARGRLNNSKSSLLKIVYTDDEPTHAEFIPYPDEESKNNGC